MMRLLGYVLYFAMLGLGVLLVFVFAFGIGVLLGFVVAGMRVVAP